jgi:hypothetical protein
LRNLIAVGYYTPTSGMKDIGYHGNVLQAEWEDPPAEAIKKLNLTQQ